MYETDGDGAARTYADHRDWPRTSRTTARERYVEYLAADEHRRKKLEADFWTAAFFWPMAKGTRWAPTFAEFLRLQAEGPEALPTERLLEVEALAEQYRFFHWHLEFPDVFGEDGDRAALTWCWATRPGSGSSCRRRSSLPGETPGLPTPAPPPSAAS